MIHMTGLNHIAAVLVGVTGLYYGCEVFLSVKYERQNTLKWFKSHRKVGCTLRSVMSLAYFTPRTFLKILQKAFLCWVGIG